MSILASLNRAYGRMADRDEVPPFGYSRINVGFVIRLDDAGTPVGKPIDFRESSGNKLVGRRLKLPSFLSQRTSGIAPNFLWDKSSYSLGVVAPDPKKSADAQIKELTRAADTHAAFVKLHRKYLTGVTDEGLVALRLFIEKWRPELFDELDWPSNLKNGNIVFALDGDDSGRYIFERPAARVLWASILADETETAEAVCLVSGTTTKTLLLHPGIKGVKDAQTSGAFLVSFNDDAYTSYGHKSGENAPVNQHVAFAYTTVLNHFLEWDSAHKIQIGGVSTIFWADASDFKAVEEAESSFKAWGSGIDENLQADKVRTVLEKIRKGRPFAEIEPDLPDGVRFYVLGLSAPSKARITIRFWIEDNFANFIKKIVQHHIDFSIEPDKLTNGLSLGILLTAMTVHVAKNETNEKVSWSIPKKQQAPQVLVGELVRAILTGGRYPRTMLTTVIQRIRAERGRITQVRASICKAVINRNARHSNQQEDIPVALDHDHPSAAYRLGRLFALLEYAQKLAIPNVGATIRDRYFAAASSTPSRVFPLLVRNGITHVAKAQKDEKTKRLAFWCEGRMGQVWSGIEPDIPKTLSLEDQGRFSVGYYHQRFAKNDKSGQGNPVAEEAETEIDVETSSSNEEEES